MSIKLRFTFQRLYIQGCRDTASEGRTQVPRGICITDSHHLLYFAFQIINHSVFRHSVNGKNNPVSLQLERTAVLCFK